MNKGSVPKFASFKPKKPDEPEATTDHEEARDKDRRTREKRETQHDTSKHERRHRHRDHGHKSAHPSRSPANRDENIKPQERAQQRSKHAATQPPQTSVEYFVDRKGDEGNLRYGSIERSKIPTYRSYLRTRILGDNGRGDGAERARSRPLSSIDRDVVRSLRGEGRRVKAGPRVSGKTSDAQVESEEEHERDFIALGRSRKRRRGSSGPESGVGGSDTSDESQDGVAPDSGDTTSFAVSQIQIKNSELQRNLKDEPQNASHWRGFINFQDKWVREGLSTGTQGRNGKDKRTIAEIKMSVYRDACDAISDEDPAKEGLLLGMLETAGLFTFSEEMRKIFERTLQKHGHFTKLWLSYIDFHLKSGANLRFETVRDLFQKCLKSTEDQRVGITPIDDDQAARKLHVFLRLTVFLRESGYVELAVALWQAILEIVFPDPAKAERWHREDTLTTVLEKLEEFWDAEEPRIGDLDADAPVPASKSSAGSDPQVAGKPASVKEDKYSAWARQELYYAQNHSLPGKSTDDSDIDDPFHVVFFADMEPFLKFDPRDMTPRLVLNAFLYFCNLPFLPGPCSHETIHWLSDPLLGVSSIFPQDESSRHGSQDPKTPDEPTTSKLLHSLHHSTSTPTTLFAPSHPFSAFAPSTPFPAIPHESISRTLKRAITSNPQDTNIAEYYLALLAHFFPLQRPRKAAKSLLKSQPSNLRLYNAYALLESRIAPAGDTKTADHIFRTALTLSSDTPSHRSDTLLLWRCWALEAVNRGEWNDALRRVLRGSCAVAGTSASCTDDSTMNDEILLQSEKQLKQALPSALASHDFTLAARLADTLILQSYLTPTLTSATPSLPAALRTTATLTPHFHNTEPNADAAHALHTLHESTALLLHTHVHAHRLPHDPRSTRQFLRDAAAWHPRASLYIQLLLAAAPDVLPFQDVLRLPLAMSTNADADADGSGEVVTLQQTAPRLRHAVCAYLGGDGGGSGSGTIHGVRAAFERAAGGNAWSVGLWGARMCFEIEAAGGGGVWDGMGWVKEGGLLRLLRLVGARCERRGVGGAGERKRRETRDEQEEAEMKEVYDAIVDRGLRVWREME